ncbi:uncharacterized protein ARMOST_08373 [Armillaria ostoyae]|uniref:Uncharacterized protein n=1 Tax=Armillaria ostoyae TaxID=47428 RepID=A0A284R8I7_ARMOS|nr:uncharacterized protein ARMOST_08373 [Armillaria ostoyae]
MVHYARQEAGLVVIKLALKKSAVQRSSLQKSQCAYKLNVGPGKPTFTTLARASPVAQIRVDPASAEEEVHWWQRFRFELTCFDTEYSEMELSGGSIERERIRGQLYMCGSTRRSEISQRTQVSCFHRFVLN